MTYTFNYQIVQITDFNQFKNGSVTASGMNDAINQIKSLLPEGWWFNFIQKEVN